MTPAGADGRGGRRQRRFAKKEGLGEIDHAAIVELLAKLAPKATDEQREMALAIVVKGIETFREHAPGVPARNDTMQTRRRALAKWEAGKTEAAPPFNSFMQFDGKLYGVAADGLYEIRDVPHPNGYEGLEDAIARPLRQLSEMQQRAAGASVVNSNIPFMGSAGVGKSGKPLSVGDVLLNEIAHPRDWEAYLAGFVYVAITKGLGLKASTTDLHQFDPIKAKTGANYCRLLVLALEQAGIEPPTEKLYPLMLKGTEEAKSGITKFPREPGTEGPEGRTYSAIEMMFPEAGS